MRLRQQQMLARVARDFRVTEADVRQRLREIRSKAAKITGEAANTPQAPTAHSHAVESRLIPETPAIAWTAAALDPRERELLELLVVHPTLAITALQELSPEDLPSSPARDIFLTYRSLEEEGLELEFPQVLSALANESLKSLFIELDERATAKDAKALQDPPTRLRSVIDRLRMHEQQREHRERLAVLEEQKLESDAELDLLQQMIELNRRRMGIHLN